MTGKSKREHSEVPVERPSGSVRKFLSVSGDFRWHEVELKTYKEEGTHFKAITRQTLFSDEPDLPCELRYFEIARGGHSTFERHVHTHAVLILRGRGRVLVADEIREIEAFDLVQVPSLTWHQFRADRDDALGFLCQVPCDRDRPVRPNAAQRQELLSEPAVAEFARF